jgi:4-diphosphocytidyl-2-C-methyl-D-erythritol kinase
MKKLRVQASAKINLFLRVLGRRGDGYHDIESVFQTIDLCDELIICESSGSTILEVPGNPSLETEDNLVVRAVRQLEKFTGESLSLNIRLIKRIPVAAGLGGGSSDAAGTLLGIRALLDLDLSDDDLLKGAALLGADVPFFLVGGTAVGEGIGDVLTRASVPTDYSLLIVNPGFPVSTKMIFEQFGRTLTGQPRRGIVWDVLGKGRGLTGLLHNDLQATTERLHPEVREISESLVDLGFDGALMTGSGPTVFGLADSGTDLLARFSGLPAERWHSFTARPVGQGALID